MFLGICVKGNQKTAPVSLVSVVTEDDHEINMQLPWAANTQQAAEEPKETTMLTCRAKKIWAQNTILHILVRSIFPKKAKNQSAAENVKQSSLLYEARSGYTTTPRKTPKIKMRDTRTA